MPAAPMKFWDSIVGRLFRLVFGGYLVLAIFVTAVQLLVEFRQTQERIRDDLAALAASFQGSVSRAAWDLDETLLAASARGIALSAIVSGVVIVSETGKTYATAGRIPAAADHRPDSVFSPYQFAEVPLAVASTKGTRELGRLTIYSDRSIALARVWESFVVILINSIIKTAGLWLIFTLVITRALTRPLAEFERVVSNFELAAGSGHVFEVDYAHPDELGRLATAMNAMQRRLLAAYHDLEQTKNHLEEIVAERTRHLAEALEWNEKVLLDSPVPMGVYRADGQCVMANEAYARFAGTTRETLLAQNFHAIPGWPASSLLGDCLMALAQRTPLGRETSMASASGDKVWFEYRILPTKLNEADHLLIQFFDLTERKRTEVELDLHRHHLERLVGERTAALSIAKDEAEAASRAKSAFLVNMRHELLTPMNAVLGMAHLVRRGGVTPRQAEQLNAVERSGRHLVQLIEDILLLAALEVGDVRPEVRDFTLPGLLDEVTAPLAEAIAAKGLALEVDVGTAPALVRGDAALLRQALSSYLGNALKFTELGSVRVTARVVAETAADCRVRFEVADTGVGIPATEVIRRQLFRPFQQLDESITRQHGGTGLGLVIARRIADLLGGDVGMDSIPGVGSTFWLTVSLGRSDAPTEASR